MITVLVVDDDFRVARIHSAFVDRVEGFRTVGVAQTGAAALAAAEALGPDLILLDLYLPDVFGLDLLNQMRVAGIEGDVIVISAADESETVERAVKLGVANYLLKPFTLNDLAARLHEYEASTRQRRPRTVGDQAEIDKIFGRAEPAGNVPALPKGMSVETAKLVRGVLLSAGQELSAQECGDRVGLSRVSARRYLEHFVARGQAQVSLRYGSPGRPERRYSAT
ncbi:MAG: sle [Friedmanniella sp.]|nr:sle [Friedmanniella sp.]